MKWDFKKCLLLFFLFAGTVFSEIRGQGGVRIESTEWATIVVWSGQTGLGKIKVYVNGTFEGYITSFYSSTPSCNAAGCVTVRVPNNRITIVRAISENNYEFYREFSSLNTSYCNPIEITEVVKQETNKSDNQSSAENTNQDDETSSTSSPYLDSSNGNSTTDEALAVAAVAAVALVAVAAVSVSTDIYVNTVQSSTYNGYLFGLKNTLSRHLDLEYGTGMYKSGVGLFDMKSLKSDEYISKQSSEYDKSLWSLDLNAIYKIFEQKDKRQRFFNPYIGFGLSSFINDEYARTGFGGIAGFSLGNRLKLHCRYKWMKNFTHDFVLLNQLEIGLSVRYQDGLFFKTDKD